MSAPRVVALIPARSGSQRIPHKNVQLLHGHPLLAYSIASALDSGVFSDVVLSTDSQAYAEIAQHYGASAPFLRSAELASEGSPDIDWIEQTLTRLAQSGKSYDAFSILRPTSPFRTADTIRRAFLEFTAEAGVDSLRAVEKCSVHPGKMWVVRGKRMLPLLPFGPADRPWHSSQYPTLPLVYQQNASLELAWTRVVFEGHTIAGNVVMPFFTDGYEGFDLNEPIDWIVAEQLVAAGEARLPSISKPAYTPATR
jgi:N-acylneuraminate cytidylyltransferase